MTDLKTKTNTEIIFLTKISHHQHFTDWNLSACFAVTGIVKIYRLLVTSMLNINRLKNFKHY